MSNFAGDWDKLKKNFDATGLKRPTGIRETMIGTIKKGTGISEVLREIDAAIAKKGRAGLAQAINKFLVMRDPFCKIISDRAKKAAMVDNDDEAATAYVSLTSGLQKIAVAASEELKKIQEKKNPGATVPMIEIEGDVKATVNAAHRTLLAFPVLLKQHKVLATADAAIQEAEKYTKAAARGDYKTAIDALTRFKAAAKKAAEDLGKISDKEKSSPGFTEAVEKFQKGMRDFSTVTRVDGAIKAMKDAQAKAATV
jgi:hypothetical protein